MRNPRGVPDKAHGWFRRWFRTLWNLRGGGLYALGYIVTFAWLEVTSVAGDIAESDGVGDFLGAQIVEFVFRFLSDSLANMIQAFLWPVELLAYRPPYGLAALVVLYAGFRTFLKPPIERWMFGGDPEPGIDADDPPTAGEH